MTHTLSRYICDYCNREYKVFKNAKHHEENCYHNPENKACATCKYFRFGINERHHLAGGDDWITEISEMYCEIDKMPYEEGSANPTVNCQWWEKLEEIHVT